MYEKNKYREYLNEKIEEYTSVNAFLSIEEFADFWFHYVVPSFNDFGARHETPNELYLTKPRARTLTPSWATMSVLLSPKYPVVVKPQGIYFGKNRYYDDLLLKEHVGQTVYIYGSDATNDHYPMYERWCIENHTLVPFFFSEEMDPFPEQETTHLSDDYLKVALWNYETNIKILKEHLSKK